MRDLSIGIIIISDQVNTGNIPFIVEFIQEFEEKSHILISEVDNPQSPFPFRSSAFIPCNHGLAFGIALRVSPHTMPPDSIHILMNSYWNLNRAHKKGGKRGDDRVY
jgi:hypothetical protein